MTHEAICIYGKENFYIPNLSDLKLEKRMMSSFLKLCRSKRMTTKRKNFPNK